MPSRRADASAVLEVIRLLIVEDDVLLLMDLQSILVEAGAQLVGLCRTVDGLPRGQIFTPFAVCHFPETQPQTVAATICSPAGTPPTAAWR